MASALSAERKLTRGGLAVAGPKGHGKFILFIRCSTCIIGVISVRKGIAACNDAHQALQGGGGWGVDGNINILLLSNRPPGTRAPYVKQIARRLHFHLKSQDRGEIEAGERPPGFSATHQRHQDAEAGRCSGERPRGGSSSQGKC